MFIKKPYYPFNHVNPHHAVVLSMNYRDFELQLSGESANHFSAKVTDNNAPEKQTFEFHTGELKVIEALQHLEEKAIASPKKETFHIEFGKELYNKVFTGKLVEYFKNCLEEVQDNDMGLRICLRFDETAQEIAARCPGNSCTMAAIFSSPAGTR